MHNTTTKNPTKLTPFLVFVPFDKDHLVLTIKNTFNTTEYLGLLLTVTNIYLIEQNQSHLCIPFSFDKVLNDLPIKLKQMSTMSTPTTLQPIHTLDRLFKGKYNDLCDSNEECYHENGRQTITNNKRQRQDNNNSTTNNQNKQKKTSSGRSRRGGKPSITKIIHDHNPASCKYCKRLVRHSKTTHISNAYIVRRCIVL